MAARGTESKTKITEKILNTFDGSFLNDKEIRIPMNENGELIQIKVTLTAAKTNVEPVGVSAESASDFPTVSTSANDAEPVRIEPTEEEKETLNDLMRKLGL